MDERDRDELESLRRFREKVAAYVGVDQEVPNIEITSRIHAVFGDADAPRWEEMNKEGLDFLWNRNTMRRKALAARLALLEPGYAAIEGEVVRRCGDIVCEACGFSLYDHPNHPAEDVVEYVLCDGSLAHL